MCLCSTALARDSGGAGISDSVCVCVCIYNKEVWLVNNVNAQLQSVREVSVSNLYSIHRLYSSDVLIQK